MRQGLIAGLFCLLAITGCRQDMQNQPKFYPQRGTTFYADGRSARTQVPGTVARSQGVINDYFHTGFIDGKVGDGLPVPLSMDLLRRGQERYNVYCTPCHSRVGNGMGMIVQRGYYPAASFHSERLRQAPLGHFFQVMTNGLGAMPDYAAQLTPQDRWAVVAYIRALQLSQNATEAEVADGHRTAALPDIAEQEGFARQFLDIWIHPTRPRPATPPAAPVVAAPTTPVVDASSAAPASVSTKPVPAPAIEAGRTTTTAVAPPTPKEPAHDLAAGQMTYMRNCAGCHQISRAGMPPNIPGLIGIVSRTGTDHVRTIIQAGVPTGKPPMPAFASLSDEDLDNLIAFLQTSK